jgi:hypothetical protein
MQVRSAKDLRKALRQVARQFAAKLRMERKPRPLGPSPRDSASCRRRTAPLAAVLAEQQGEGKDA